MFLVECTTPCMYKGGSARLQSKFVYAAGLDTRRGKGSSKEKKRKITCSFSLKNPQGVAILAKKATHPLWIICLAQEVETIEAKKAL